MEYECCGCFDWLGRTMPMPLVVADKWKDKETFKKAFFSSNLIF